MIRPRRARAAAVIAALALRCETPATGVLVVVGTDLDPALPLTVTARIGRGLDGGEGRLAGPWTRAEGDGGDGGVALPLSFGVVPGDGPVEEPVAVLVEGVVGGVTLRRRASFTFVPRQTGVLRVFLTQRCAEPANGCVEPVRCTVQQLCEEQGLTCGNEGLCVAIRVPLSDDRDASFGDITPGAACGDYGQRCCSLGPACEGAHTCVDGTCRRCADPEQRCCDGPALRPDGAACAASADPCRRAGTCTDGVCGAGSNEPDGTPCGSASGPCSSAPTCQGGVCGPGIREPDGTTCGTASGPCASAPTCERGVCQPRAAFDGTPCGAAVGPCARSVCQGGACVPRNVPEGTPCGAATGPCSRAPACVAGACVPRPAADGTPCGASPGACRRAPVCMGGQCRPAAPVADDTVCGPAADECHLASVCRGGACTVRNAPAGTRCGGANGPCLRPRVCGGGACQAAAPEPNGTVCEAARNPCEAAAVCSGGRCGGHAPRPDDSPWGGGGFNRCCDGRAVVVNTAARCGGCRIACRTGSCRAALGRYYCGCSGSNAQCAPGICRNESPNANLCACQNSGDCPSGMRCVDVSFNPNYCTF